MTISVLFILLISFVGLTLLTHVITHQKICRARSKKISGTDDIRQDLIRYLHFFRKKALLEDMNRFGEPASEYFNPAFFPDFQEGDAFITNAFRHFDIQEPGYKKTRIFNEIDARSNQNNFRLASEVVMELLSGSIPLSLFPFFINRETQANEEAFLEENRITITGDRYFIVDEVDADFNVAEFLLYSLKIKGDVLDWRAVRERFGFEPSDAPIDDGIYLILGDTGDFVESVFVQGDVERLIFSALDTVQCVRIQKGGKLYEIRYRPGEPYFLCWDGRVPGESIFKERIVVNGSVWSMGQENGPGLVETADIKLLVSGTTVITTSLETDNLSLSKLKLANLTLICSAHDLYNLDSGEPEVRVAAGEKADLHLSMLLNGRLVNETRDLKLSGSLYAKDIQNNGSMTLTHLKSRFDSGGFFATRNFKYINKFFVNFIQEVENEDQ